MPGPPQKRPLAGRIIGVLFGVVFLAMGLLVLGLAASTVLSLVIVPVFYALLKIIQDRVWGADAPNGPSAGGAAPPASSGH